jgi:D-3-phosphoglycerate dehydrogenase
LQTQLSVVVQTDFAWPDTSVERGVLESAGHTLVTGNSAPASRESIEQLIAAHDPQAIMTCWAQISAHAIATPTDLRIVQRIGVGLDNIAVAAATARGAWVANVPDYCATEVSDHAIALLLSWARGTVALDRDVKAGRWDPATAKLRRLSDLTVGIVGYGRIGRRTAAKVKAFGCRVLVHGREKMIVEGAAIDANVEARSLEELLSVSEVVILHLPLTAATHHLIDATRLQLMRSGAYLINVSRGPLVDNEALLAALQSGRLSGAGLDVIEGEPDVPRALVERPDVIVTPHVAFSSDASLIELRRRSAEEVVRVLAGETPHHPCNHPAKRS